MADNLKDLEGMSVVVKEFRMIGKLNRTALLNMLVKEHELIGDKLENPAAAFEDLKREYLAAGGRSNSNFIPFIKRVREHARNLPGQPYYGLKDAKELVESW